jgi:hypothetical protein
MYYFCPGELAERSIAAVLKTVEVLKPPGVRIPNSPLRKMPFRGTQGNICDAQGNFLMSSNGVWIANANNDTMLNGSGLNPGYFVNGSPKGLLIPNGNFFIPTPGDTAGYTLFHQTELDPNTSRCGVYYSEININLDAGLGEVVSKNNLLIDDSLNWGIAACKHANGRDWWIISAKDSSDKIYKLLYTEQGVISIDTQSLNFYPHPYKNVSQICFNNEGNLFAYNIYDNPVDRNSFVILCDFDRCTGDFTNTRVIPVYSGAYIWVCRFLQMVSIYTPIHPPISSRSIQQHYK